MKFLKLKFKSPLLPERLNPNAQLVPPNGVLLLNFLQQRFPLIFMPKFLLHHLNLIPINFNLPFLIDDLPLFKNRLLKIPIRISEGKLKLLNSFIRKLLFEFIGILPVENICFLYHRIDVVLNVSYQRYFVYVHLFDEIDELLFNFYVELPNLFFVLLGTCLEVGHSLLHHFPIFRQRFCYFFLLREQTLRIFS